MAVLERNFGSECFEPLEMLVDWPLSDGAASWQRNLYDP
jgi:hypothetical protein